MLPVVVFMVVVDDLDFCADICDAETEAVVA